MRVVELSNHPGDMLDDAARHRQAAERRALSVYQDELVRYRARVQGAKVSRDRARAGHRWWAWLRLSIAAWRVKRGIPRPPVPADELERFLAGRGHPAEVRRVVILAHARSRLGTVRNPTVLAGTSAGYALDLVEASASRLDGEQRAAIADLIRRDHVFHSQRHRSSRQRSSRRGPSR